MIISMLDAATIGDDISLEPIKKLGETQIYSTTAPDEVCERIKNSDVVIVNKVKLGEENLSSAARVKLICVLATGFDNIDIDYCRRQKIAVCNVVGYSTNSVAQITLAMALSLYSNLEIFSDFVRSGEYSDSGIANRLVPAYREMSGKVWGVIGAGNIGKQVIRCAEALGCKTLAYKRTPEAGLETAGIDDLCSRADIISIHTPLNEGTRNLINKERIALMKRSVVLINTARGAVTDEAAIAEAIREKRIAAFGCDVYSSEPFGKNHPFYEICSLKNVCLLPHMAWGALEARRRCVEETALNIEAFFGGKVHNRVDIVER